MTFPKMTPANKEGLRVALVVTGAFMSAASWFAIGLVAAVKHATR